MDANVILRLDGFLVEVQLQLEAINEIKTDHHDAYSFGRELDLMGALEKPDGLEAAPVETTIAYTLARTVPALFSLLVAILYLDVFTCRGLRLFVRRADPDTWRGFEKPYVVHRIYGVALAAPYLANVYMLARAGGLFGRAAIAGILAYYHAPAPFWISRLGGVLFGYATAVVIEKRVKVGAFCSVVICLTQFWWGAISGVVVGCAAVAFAPRRGEREKVRSYAHTTKASVAADRGRLPLWACCVYFCATSTFIALAGFGVFSTDPSSCSPCNCKENTLIDCYADAKTLELTDSSWNGIQSYLPRWVNLANDGIKAIEPGAFEGMSRLEELVLKKNRISTIEPNTFAGLGKLWYLDLGKNKIQVVKSNAFLGLHNLEEIDLKWNRITRLEDGAFAGLDRLQWLELDGNPVITCADARAAGLPESVSCRD